MKIKDYLENLPIGEVITNSRVLSALKRAGYIYDYEYGYLIGKRLKVYWEDGAVTSSSYHLFPQKNAHSDLSDDRDEWLETGILGNEIEYKGITLGIKYLSGCFAPYLYKMAGPVTGEIEKHEPSMSLGIMGGGVI